MDTGRVDQLALKCSLQQALLSSPLASRPTMEMHEGQNWPLRELQSSGERTRVRMWSQKLLSVTSQPTGQNVSGKRTGDSGPAAITSVTAGAPSHVPG